MKREFLQNLKAGDQVLSKEVIDAIMAENGRDIETAKAAFADYDAIKEQLAQAQEAIKGYEALDIDGIRRAAQEWEDKYNSTVTEHQKQLEQITFSNALENAIAAAKGRNAKAITALLDLDALKESQDPREAIGQALEALKRDSAYLFDETTTPPLYARGTGAYTAPEERNPETLAGALREKFELRY